MQRHLSLHRHGAAHRPVDAVEYDQQRVAAGLHDPATVLVDRWIDQVLTKLAQPLQRACIVQPDQPAVADHVGMDDSDQLTPIRRCPECVRCLGRRHSGASASPCDAACYTMAPARCYRR